MRKKLPIALVVVFLSVVLSFALSLPISSSALSIASFSNFDVTSLSLLREYEVLLKSRRFVPSPGIGRIARAKVESMSSERAHVLIQFKHIPNSVERNTLMDNGVRLLAYIPNKAWFASISTASPVDIAMLPFVRSIELILPEDKISPHIGESGVSPWAINHDGTVNLVVVFFGDVPEGEAQNILGRYGTNTQGPGMLNDYTITAFANVIQSLANEDAVQWIESVSPPDEDNNDGLRARIDANTVQAAPYNLDGSGVIIGQWERWNPQQDHLDFQGRVTIVEDWGIGPSTEPAYKRYHATRVAGVFGGNGARSEEMEYQPLQFRGVAPNVEWFSYSTQDDDEEPEEHKDAIIDRNIDLSQNSWGIIDDNYRGNYELRSAKYDNITIGAYGKRIPVIFSVGNEEQLFNTVMPPGGTAKNTIAVANIDSDSDKLPTQTAWGPTDDGRLKPDLVAPGSEHSPWVSGDTGILSESIWTTYWDNTYRGGIGTSFSAPAVSGSVALMLQAYRITHNNTDPLPSTIKAILIQTARDVNVSGPDYRTGYGLINVTAAVDLIRSDGVINNVIVEGVISESGQAFYQTDFHSILVPEGQPELKVTLVWDDYPGTANAAKTLVNDLDLILIAPDGAVHYPWVLDPQSPSDLAKTGPDHINNVEQIDVTSPTAGKWTVIINGTDVPHLGQTYSLVCNNLDWNTEFVDSCDVIGTSMAIGSFYPLYIPKPHIAYLCALPDRNNTNQIDLRHAYHDGSAWNIDTVHSWPHTWSYQGFECSIALDSSNNPHIAYIYSPEYDSSHLYYAYNDGSGWHNEAVDTNAIKAQLPSLALDSYDNPHISYVELPHYGGWAGDLKYAYKDGSGWHLLTISEPGTPPQAKEGYYNSLTLDSSNNPHIAYDSYDYNGTNYNRTLEYARGTPPLSNTSWSFDVVDVVEGTAAFGIDASIALDSLDRPHIAYTHLTNYPSMPPLVDYDLKYAHYNGLAWDTDTIDSAGDVGFYASIALDTLDRPRISYLDGSNGALKYAYHDGLMWNTKTIDSKPLDAYGSVGQYSSISVEVSGIPHISYGVYQYDPTYLVGVEYAKGGGLVYDYGLITVSYHFEIGTFAGWDFSSSTNGAQSGTIDYYGEPVAEWNSTIVYDDMALSGSYSARLFADFWQHTGAVGPWRADAAINRTVNRAGASILRASLKFNDIQGSGGVGLSYFGIFVYNALNTSKRVFYGFTTTGDYGDIRYTVGPGELVNFERNIVTDYFNKYGENLPDQIMICLLSSADYAEGTGERRTADVIVDDILIVALRDMATTSVTPSKTVVGQGYFMSINITVENRGDFSETFSVTAYANTSIIQPKTITLASGNSTTVTVTWNTMGWAKGNYILSAYAWPVPGETDTTDNTLFADKCIYVTIPGDVDGDFDVDLFDAVKLLRVYGAKVGTPDYDPNLDINDNGQVYLYDAVILLTHYGQKDP